MATGLSSLAATAILDAICNATAYSEAAIYIQLHTADPGASGTTAVAGNEVRKAVSFGAASGGAVSSDAAVSWSTSEVDTTEDYTHYSLWDASTSGNFIASGTITANAVTTGDSFTIPSGDIDLSFPIAS